MVSFISLVTITIILLSYIFHTLKKFYSVVFESEFVDKISKYHSISIFKTLGLLCAMANERNVITISARLLEYLKTTEDNYVQKDILKKISQLTKRLVIAIFKHVYSILPASYILINTGYHNKAYRNIEKHIFLYSVIYDGI